MLVTSGLHCVGVGAGKLDSIGPLDSSEIDLVLAKHSKSLVVSLPEET